MDTRRDFIRKTAIAGAALCLPATLMREGQAAYPELKTRNPKKTLVLWHSQTGQTRRYARLIGTPVFYYDIPANVSDWLETIPY